MKLTIIVPDNVIGIDGVFHSVENLASLVPANLWALQWDGAAGVEEHYEGSNTPVASLEAYQAAIDAWVAKSDTIPDGIPETPEQRLTRLAPQKLQEINVAFESSLAPYQETYPLSEKLTWPQQRAESLAWTIWADPAGNNRAGAEPPTPVLDLIASNRGIPRELLLEKTYGKVVLFEQVSAVAVGRRQNREDQLTFTYAAYQAGEITATQAADTIEAIQW